ncbi:MAG: di-trans,poly-cis-decaprenylcistransferase [Acidobacteria bacterium]|nr:di-trans,poly-cis-decaprenylcistransferase [Acidobacteriota bacterium]
MADRKLHVACIMDGNGRWARRRGLPRTAGHTAGEEALAVITRAAGDRNIGWLTVFGFSTENWIRPRAEVRHILAMHKKLFGRLDELNENDVRVNWIGRRFDEPGSRTPGYVQRAIKRAIDDTAGNTRMVFTVAFDYGGRAELTRAAQLASSGRGAAHVDPKQISDALYDPSLPDVDLLIRTSGETRISNFLLWQINGAKVYFTEKTWPDMTAEEFDRALAVLN